MRHLADALERGAAPELVSKHINLGSNPATNTEVAAFVCKHRYQPTQLLDGAFLVERCAGANFAENSSCTTTCRRRFESSQACF